MTIRTRVVELTVGPGGSVAGSVSVGPAEYRGCYYEFKTDDSGANVDIRSLGRSIQTKNGAVNADGVQQLSPENAKLVDGAIVVSVDGATEDDRISFRLFVDY